jgi:OmpA-OmpF porin, OOP family
MRLLIFLALLAADVAGIAQNVPGPAVIRNLVPNSSFENYRRRSGDVRKAIPWQPIETIDYYQRPLTNDTTPEKGGFAGDCYTGFRFRKKYKEFLQVRLIESLHRGTVYEVSVWVRLAFWSNASLRSFGVLLSKGGYKGQTIAQRANMVDTICEKGGLVNNYRWFEIKGFYKADGGEKYITIGNFSPKIGKDMVRLDVFRLGAKESYYFVDEVSVKKAAEFEEKVAVEIVGPDYKANWEDSTLKVKENINVGETVQLNNIFFVNGRYYLLPESYTELNKLSQYLIKNPNIEISINGHSDNTGMKHRNQKMSELRAREVFEYLIKKGVQNKMYYKGYGSSRPVAGNDTEEGRARNRRVEFEIIKK